MQRSDILDLIDDRMNARVESLAQTMIKLHEDHNQQMLKMVSEQINTTVNGKIDKIQRLLEELDKRIIPFEENKKWWQKSKDGSAWLAGFVTSISLIATALFWLIKQFNGN